MIKINLLGDKGSVNQTTRYFIAGYIATVAACFLSFLLLYITTTSTVSVLKKETTALQSSLDSLKKKTKAVRDLEDKKESLQGKLTVIATLKKSKTGPVRVLDDMNLAVPSRVWLREVRERSRDFRIKGRALDNQDIALLMNNLEKSEFFESVELLESRQMYYSRSSGKVTPLPTTQKLRTPDFAADSRATREEATARWTVRGGSKRDDEKSKGNSNENQEFVKIKEFVLSMRVKYAGNLETEQARRDSEKTKK